MSGEPVPPASEAHEPEPRRRAARAGIAPQADLERLRDAIQRRLDEVEALARQRLDAAGRDGDPEQERALRRRVAELEESIERMRVFAAHREQEWQAAFEQLEEERQLLTEAWDRLERERVDGQAEPAAPRPPRAHPASAPAPAPADPFAVPQPRSQNAGTPDDSVTQAILQQFHMLRSDVRKTAHRRNGY